MSGIMDPTIRSNEPGNHLQIGIDRDRSFDEMFSDLSGSFREIVAAITAGKARRIDCGNGDTFVGGVKQFHCFLEGKPEIERFYPAEKFLERCEMRHDREIKDLLNFLHVSDIFDEFPIMLVPVILEKNKRE